MATDVETPMLQPTDHDTSSSSSSGSSSSSSSQEEPAACHRPPSPGSGGEERPDSDLLERLEPQPSGPELEIELNKENDQNQQEPADKSLKNFTEAPPPKINPWTKKKNMVTANSVNVSSQETVSEAQSATKVIKANKPKTIKKSGKASDFSDITNWPTPGEMANKEHHNIMNQPSKKPLNKNKKKDKTEKKDNSESKENRETLQNDDEEKSAIDDESQGSSQKGKKGRFFYTEIP